MSKNDKKPSTFDFTESTLNASGDHVLEALHRTTSELQENLIQAWVQHSNIQAVYLVSESASVSTVLRKTAKRGLAVLKSRGLTPKPTETATKSIFTEDIALEARCTFPDSEGSQIWWIIQSSSLGKHDLVEVTTNDRAGLVDLKYGYPKGGSIRQLWQSMAGRTGRIPALIPVEYARSRIALAYHISLARNAVLPMGFDATSKLLGDLEHQPSSMPHPIEGASLELPTDESVIQSRLAHSMMLHQLPELNSWIPESSASLSMMQTIDEKVEALKAKENADEEHVRTELSEVINHATRDAVNAYFNDERKKLYIARLHDTAWSLLQANQRESAIDALLLANAIKEAGIVSNQPSEVPFLLGMFVKFVLHVQQHIAKRTHQEFAQAEAAV